MITHFHLCSECGLEWQCHDLECVGVQTMFCAECALELELEANESPTKSPRLP